ncbi:MAG: tyrosine protein phosphatase [Citrobacter freundii]|nr:MAG: tyrosine protein phosphatase [Citrobacter freundii]
MPNRIYWIGEFSGSKIGIMARPRGNEWLVHEIDHFKKQNVNVIVSLLENDEIIELGLEKEPELCTQAGIIFLHFPVKDRSVPDSFHRTSQFILSTADLLSSGLNLVFHCRMGIGRSSIMAAALLIKKGEKVDRIIPCISAIRGLKVPDTVEQVSWLEQLEGRI